MSKLTLLSAAVIATIEEYCDPDLIVQAGYRRRLSSKFLNRYHNRIINLYPGDIARLPCRNF